MSQPRYDFTAAQGFTTEQDQTVGDIADSLKDAALYLVNANWDEKNREELIYNMQVAATDVLNFLRCIREVKD